MAEKLPSWDETTEVQDLPSWDQTSEVSQKTPPSIVESGFRGAAQGLTFGFADEITGGLESLFTDKTYEQARDESRAAYKEAQEANPGTYLTGELGSALVPGLGILKGVQAGSKLTKLASKSPTIAKLIKNNPKLSQAVAEGVGTGAIMGAGAGLGASEEETVLGQVSDTLEGAAMGGAVGGALPATGAIAKKGIKSASKLLGKGKEEVVDFATGTTRGDRDALYDRYFAEAEGGQKVRELVEDDPIQSVRRVKGAIKGQLKNLNEDIDNLKSTADEMLEDESFNVKIDDIVDIFDDMETIAKAKNPGMSATDEAAIRSAKRDYRQYGELSSIRMNQLKKEAADISSEASAKKKEYYDLGNRLEKEVNENEILEQRLQDLREKYGKYWQHFDKKNFRINDYANLKKGKSGTSDFIKNLDDEANQFYGDDAKLMSNPSEAFRNELEDAFFEIRQIRDNIAANKRAGKVDQSKLSTLEREIGNMLVKRDGIRDEANAIKNAIELGQTVSDANGMVSGKNIKNIVDNLRNKVSDWEKGRKMGKISSSQVKEDYIKGVQSTIDKKMLKGLEPEIDENMNISWKEADPFVSDDPFSMYSDTLDPYESGIAQKQRYRDVMSDLEKRVEVKESMLGDVMGLRKKGAAGKDSVDNKLLRVARQLSDPKYKGTIADSIRQFDSVTKGEIYDRLRELGLLEKFTGKNAYSGSVSPGAFAGQWVAKLAAPAAKKAIQSKAVFNSKVGQMIKKGNLAKTGKYATQFTEALRTGGIPAVVSLEYTLSQQDPEFRKLMMEDE